MNENELRYALSKQLGSAHTIQTSYGDIALDAQMRAAVEKVLRPILEKKLKRVGGA